MDVRCDSVPTPNPAPVGCVTIFSTDGATEIPRSLRSLGMTRPAVIPSEEGDFGTLARRVVPWRRTSEREIDPTRERFPPTGLSRR
jgi:hypothetical protein